MTLWNAIGYVFLAILILAMVAGFGYFMAWMILYYIPKFAEKMDARMKGVCRLCGMDKRLGHWPGCDYWTGENLDLLIFKGYEKDGGEA